MERISKRATKFRALLLKMTYKDTASEYGMDLTLHMNVSGTILTHEKAQSVERKHIKVPSFQTTSHIAQSWHTFDQPLLLLVHMPQNIVISVSLCACMCV